MDIIRFMLEYRCSPIWIENEAGELLGNGLPTELEMDCELADRLNEIREVFDSLYEDNHICFSYNGFSSRFEKEAFFGKVSQAIELLKINAANRYLIQVDVDEASY